METGFLSFIPCDLMFIKIKLSVRKHNLFLLCYIYCSASFLSCSSARLFVVTQTVEPVLLILHTCQLYSVLCQSFSIRRAVVSLNGV